MEFQWLCDVPLGKGNKVFTNVKTRWINMLILMKQFMEQFKTQVDPVEVISLVTIFLVLIESLGATLNPRTYTRGGHWWLGSLGLGISKLTIRKSR